VACYRAAMNRTLLAVSVVLLLSACATTPTTFDAYEQAAPAYVPVAPPPAYTPGFAPGTPAEPVYTPPGTGLPMPGQPDYGQPEVPRSDNNRVLDDEYSPHREPGLWAADGNPVASADAMPPIFDIQLPYPANATTPDARWWSDMCGKTMNDAAKRLGTDAEFASHPPYMRMCLAARAYLRCADGVQDVFRSPSTAGVQPRPSPRAVRDMRAHAVELVKHNCVHHDIPEQSEERLRETFDAWAEGLPDAMKAIPGP
jgi:hypothetical protein